MSDSETKRRCRVGIAGFGTVGQAVARILSSGMHPELQLTHVCNRNVTRKRVDWVSSGVMWTDSFEDLLDGDVDAVVELIGGISPATEWIERALKAGTAVVTANKQVIARVGGALANLAATQRQHLLFEAAVAGGIPIVRSLREGISSDRLIRIQGILNGTCNYILTQMEQEHVSFGEALSDAQRLGFAEADPTEDVDGLDAQAKLAILISVGLGRCVEVEDIPVSPITAIEPVDFAYAQRLGCVIRQIAHAELVPNSERIRAFVQPALVPEASSLGRVGGTQNIVVVGGEFGGETAFSGYGAGGEPTAVAVVSDLLAISRGAPLAQIPPGAGKEADSVLSEFEAPHYLRFMIKDRPGIIAAAAEVFSRHGVNIDAVLQEPGWSKTELPFVVTLERCGSSVVSAAMGEIRQLDFHVRPPLWLPILSGEEGRG